MGTSLHENGDIVIDAEKQLSYRILSILGEGNSGITYIAEDIVNNNNQVAIKVLSFTQSGDWKMMELFEREAKVLSILKHSGIPRYINYFYIDTEKDRKFYIVQELAPGKPLSAWVEEGMRWSEKEICHFAEQILRILMYLQRITPPVIHRDIKPENIIRDSNNSFRLVDFGAVRDTYYSTLMHGSTVVGTYGYMAPEQFRGHSVPATDLYGLGATILYLLTHRSPAEIPQSGLAIDFRDRIKVSPGFANWLEKMLAPDANDRYSTAQVALNELRQLQKVKVKQKKSRTKVEVAIAVFLVTGTALWFGNVNKWRLFSSLGLVPRDICSNPSTLKDYLQQGGNPNIQVKTSSYSHISKPLLYCVPTKNIEILLKHGADPNQDIYILVEAVSVNDVKRVQLLFKYGLNLKINSNKDKKIFTYLIHIVVYKNQVKMLKVLLNNGIDINVIDSYNYTPLDRALFRHFSDAAKILIKKGAVTNRYKNYKNQDYLESIKEEIKREKMI